MVAVAMVDVDNFKTFNDAYGHARGDEALRAIARELREAVDGSVGRYSGDEFCLVLPGRTLEQAFLEMEALRRRMVTACAPFGMPDGTTLAVTIGLAQHPRDAKTARDLLQLADRALFAAKEQGGNQVGLPPNEEMVLRSCYYPASSLRRLRALAEQLGRKESPLLREALEDLFLKYKAPLPPGSA
jgi:diguanylate cyclase (GGDEF)-like protein